MEIEILNFIHNNLSNPILDAVLVFFTMIVEHGELWLEIGGAMLITKKYRRVGACVLIAVALSFVCSELLLKNIVCRPRPFLENPDINLIISPPSGFSFPSSHSTVSFAAATVILYFDKRLIGISCLIFACLTAFSRLYLYVHYPTDVLAGVILGMIFGAAVILGYRFFIHRTKNKLNS